MTIEKWSKSEDEHAKCAVDLYAKWRKCMRRIPLKEKKEPSAEPEKGTEIEKSLTKPPPLQQMAPVNRIKEETLEQKPKKSIEKLKRKREEDINPEVRAQLRQERRKRFEEQIAQEDEMRVQAQLNIDERLREALGKNLKYNCGGLIGL